MAIIRGTTPTITAKLPFDTVLVDFGLVIVRQNASPVIEREFSTCECKGNTVSAKFTQKETLDLSSKYNAEIDIVVKTTSGDRFETEHPYVVKVADTVKDEVI